MAKISMNSLIIVAGTVLLLLATMTVVTGDQDNPKNENENKDLVITDREKPMLDQFKEQVLHHLPHEYMKEDMYLVRWLRAKNFDMHSAEADLMENLRWRSEYKMDEIQQEDFSDVKDDFPVYIDTFARNGQPVITAVAGQWDLRQGFLTGRDKRVLRYVYQTLDKAAIMAREAQEAGKNVTRFDILLSLDGFNIIQHGCARCMKAIMEVIQLFEKYYPEAIDRITLINTPSYISTLFESIIKAAISGSSADSPHLKLLGTDKNEVRAYLLQFIDENELPEEFGGLRERADKEE